MLWKKNARCFCYQQELARFQFLLLSLCPPPPKLHRPLSGGGERPRPLRLAPPNKLVNSLDGDGDVGSGAGR